MISYGFYDSKNHDRKYNAIQFGSMFDGIIKDGVFMSIGTCFRVIPGEDMTVLVGIGRAWFNHTWTYNDAPLPITIPQSEVLLDRIDAVVLDINSDDNARVNDVIVVKGTPSNSPQNPTLINTKERHQYPLAYISVRSGVASIRAADITSMVGTSSTPYVTGILETVNIDALIDQWRDQWNEFFEIQSDDMKKTSEFWKTEWQKWYEAQTKEIQDSYLAWEQEWILWSNNYKTMMEDTAEEWKSLWDAWFYSYVNENTAEMTRWKNERDTEFRTWFDSLKALLDEDAAASLAQALVNLQDRVNILEMFKSNLTNEYTVYNEIQDNNNETILDSDGLPINGKVVFVVK